MSQQQSAVRLVAVCVLGLVVLTSLSTVAVGHGSTTSLEPATASLDDGASPPAPVRSTPVPATADAASTAGIAPQPGTSASTSLDVDPVALGADVVSLRTVGDGPSHLALPTDGGEGESPLGPSGLIVLAGYSRYGDADPLDNDVRARIHDAIRQSPGLYPAALVERLDVSRSTVRYHLRVLADADLVSERSIDGRRRYVTQEATAAERALAVIDSGTTAATIVDHLARDGSATVSDLATRLDCSAGTVSYHLNRLEESGVVSRERDGRIVENQLTPEVEPLVSSPTDSDPFSVTTDD